MSRALSDDVFDLELDELEEPVASEDLRRSGARPVVPTDDPDRIVERLLLGGDARGAIAACARFYGVAVGRLCFILLGSQSEADEAAQETMLAAFRAVPSYRGEGAPRAWLFGIARRICAQRQLSAGRRARRSVLLRSDESGRDASELHDDAERAARLQTALAVISASDREIIALRYESERSFKDIAGLLGIDEATARKRVGRALVRLRAFIDAGESEEWGREACG